jgi:hypothetical protein
VIGFFARYRFALYFLMVGGIAAGVALNWNWVTVTQLLRILAFLPCMVMMFMCMKGGSGGPDPDEVTAQPAGVLPSQPGTPSNPQ